MRIKSFFAATLIQILTQLLFQSVAHSFPDMIRHGYVNCTTCHASPAGGGILNPYGRSLSRELISTWGYKNEEKVFHGLIGNSEENEQHVLIGGDTRYISRHIEKDNGTRIDEGFLMQAQAKFAVIYNELKFLFSLGKIENPRESAEVKLESTEFYLIWNIKDDVSIRAGRFEPIYGLRLPDHNLWIKSEAKLVPWIEREGLEMVFEGEQRMLSFSGFQSTSQTDPFLQHTGFTSSLYEYYNNNSKIGFSLMNSEGQQQRFKTYSVHWLHTFSEKIYLMVEVTRASQNSSESNIGFTRLGYEMHKGITPIFQAESKQTLTKSGQKQNKYGLGLIWHPRPHFEVFAVGSLQQQESNSSNEVNLVLHYYL